MLREAINVSGMRSWRYVPPSRQTSDNTGHDDKDGSGEAGYASQ